MVTTSGKGESPRRVRVSSPRLRARRTGPHRPVAAEITEETGLGEVYVDSLRWAQLRLSLSVLGGMAAVVVALPLLFVTLPLARELRVGPVPLPWVLLGVLIYPFALLVSRTYVRAAERLERDFAELLRRP